MQIVYARCGGIDVHKKVLAVCSLWTDEQGEHMEEAKFGTYTRDLRALAEWFQQRGVWDVAMEATGPYWRPVWNVLEESGLRLSLANPGHIRAIPGHKTDRRDARWLADLHRHGLVPASFVPNAAQRRLRDLTRMRSKVVYDHSRVVSRIQAVLEDANIKLSSVVSDVMGVSAQRMLGALMEGQRQPTALADLARGRLRGKRAALELALEGNFGREHGFVLQRLLIQARMLTAQIKALESEIARRLDESQKRALQLWDTIPGVNATVAVILVAELGTRPEQFPDAHHAASWVAICPGDHESAGKKKSGKMRKGNRWLKTALVEAAWAAARSKGTYLSALYAHFVRRKGEKRALVAVAHSMLVSAYQMLRNNQTYQDLGPDHFDRMAPLEKAQRMVKRLERLGYRVELSPSELTQPVVSA
jgi:transposase